MSLHRGAHAASHDISGMQDAVTTCCESMDKLQTATEGGHSDLAFKEALGSLAARLGQAEKALQKAGAQQVGNSSRIAAMASQRAHLQGGLEECGRQLASLRQEVRSSVMMTLRSHQIGQQHRQKMFRNAVYLAVIAGSTAAPRTNGDTVHWGIVSGDYPSHRASRAA